MTVLVTGARGRIARSIIDTLLVAEPDDLRATSRDPAALALTIPCLRADLADPPSLRPALIGVDQVVLHAVADGLDELVGVLQEARVSHVVLLSSIAVSDAPAGAVGRVHRAVEDVVLGSGITTTLLRVGECAVDTLGWAGGLRTRGAVETPHPDARTRPVHERDVADVVLDALRGGPTRGRTLTLTGPESLSFRDQVAVLARETGREIEVVELTPASYRDRLAPAPASVAEALLAAWSATVERPQPVHPVSEVLDRPARTYAEWVRDHRAAFGS